MTCDGVITRGLMLPAIGRYQLCLYVDRYAAGFGRRGPWRFDESRGHGWLRTWGIDAGRLRYRAVLQKMAPGQRWDWGTL